MGAGSGRLWNGDVGTAAGGASAEVAQTLCIVLAGDGLGHTSRRGIDNPRVEHGNFFGVAVARWLASRDPDVDVGFTVA
jgi:hypothetical protein